MNKNKKKMDDGNIKTELELLVKLLSKRYILAPILFALLYLLEHPNTSITHTIHSFLRGLLIV
jgi:hypothetical protein